MYADRELRVQVIGPIARPLYEVADLETFKTAFRSLVKSALGKSAAECARMSLTNLFCQFTMIYSRKRAFFIETSVSAT